MSEYSYLAKDELGVRKEGAVAAASRYDALSQLRSQGLTVIELSSDSPEPDPMPLPKEALRERREERRPGKARWRPKRTSFSLGRSRITLSEKAIFCRQLSISVSSGVPLRDALASIAVDVENPGFKHVLEGVLRRLHEGESFSRALAEQENVFGRRFVALMRSAEEAGSMAETLEHLSVTLERNERLLRKIRSITAYPTFILGFFCIICVVMTVFILPKFEDALGDLGGEMPALTKMVFGVNRFILDHKWLFMAGVVGLGALFALYKRSKVGKRQLDALKLKVPFFGTCIRQIALARICRNLAIMVRGGVPITTAVEISSGLSGNVVLESALLQARERILAGNDIAGSLAQTGTFPRLVIRMVSVGESSGRLPEVLDKVADTYEDQAEGAIMLATSMLEPVMLCFFGAIILVLVLAIYLPVMTRASQMGK